MNIRELNPSDAVDLRFMDILERSSFDLSGNDPTELSDVIKYMAENGKIFLGCDTLNSGETIPDDLSRVIGYNKAKGGEELPIGFIELITLDKVYEFYRERSSDLSLVESPLMVSMGGAKQVYETAQRYQEDSSKIVVHHGIGIHKDYQNQGEGKELLNYAMNDDLVSGKVINCNIDIAKMEIRDDLVDVFNDRSFALHLNHHDFVVAGVLQPPVYNEETIYAATLLVPGIEFVGSPIVVNIKESRKDPKEIVKEIDRLTKSGYVGTSYNREQQTMTFMKPE